MAMHRTVVIAVFLFISTAAVAQPADRYEAREQLIEKLGEHGDRVSAANMLVGQLNDPNAHVRHAAAMLIFERTYTPPEVLPTVITLAETHADPDVRSWLVGAVGTTTADASEAVAPLIRILHNDAHFESRANSAAALSRLKIQPDVTIPALIKALGDPHPYVRGETAYALAEFDSDAAAALPALKKLTADTAPYAADRARYAVIRISLPDDAASAVPILIAAMSDPFYGTRGWAAKRAGQFGKDAAPAAPALIALVEAVKREVLPQSGTGEVNWVEQVGGPAALALGYIGAAPGVVDALNDALTSRSWLVRRNAAYAVRNIGPPASVAAPNLVKLLDDEKGEIAYGAEVALEAIAPAGREAIPLLVDFLHRPDHDRLATVVRVIGMMGDLGDDALEGVEMIAHLAAKSRQTVVRSYAAYAMKGLAAHHPDLCVPHLITLVEKANHADRDNIIDALGIAGPAAAEAAPLLLKHLNDQAYSQEYHSLAIALGRIHTDAPTFVPALLKRLETANGKLRAEIAFALGMYGPEAQAALLVLKTIATDGKFSIERRYAAEAVRRIDPQGALPHHE